MRIQSAWLKAALPYFAISAVAAIVWGHTLKFEFVWDDRSFIEELTSIRSLKNVPAMFYRLDAQSSAPQDFKLFRPLRTVHYAVLYWMGGKAEPQAWLFHTASLVWHMAAAMLLFAVTCRLMSRIRGWVQADVEAEVHRIDRGWAWWVALAFAAHPIVSEVVCWAKSLDDSMATVFTLLSLRALLKWDGRVRTYAAAIIWFALAAYSKISAVPFAAAVFFVFVLVMRFPSLRAARLTTPFAIVALVFMVHRHLVIGQSGQTAPISGTYAQTLTDMLPVAPKYLRLLFGVPPFCIDYSYMKGHFPLLSIPVLLGAATLLIGTWLAFMFLRSRPTCLAGVGILWLGLFLLPVSNLLPMMQYMAERFLYLPLIGFLWTVSVLFREVLRPKLAVPISLAAITAWMALAWDRSWIWQDELTLFMQSHQAGPYTPRVAENARRAVFKLPHIKAMFTLDEEKQALRLSASARTANAERIEKTLLQAAELFPDDEHIATALGILYGTTGREQQAVPRFRIATARKPDNPRYWANLGHACLETRAFDEAEQALHQAVTLSPNNVEALRSLSRLYWLREQYGESTKVLQTLQQLEPANTEYAQWIQQAEKLTIQGRRP